MVCHCAAEHGKVKRFVGPELEIDYVDPSCKDISRWYKIQPRSKVVVFTLRCPFLAAFTATDYSSASNKDPYYLPPGPIRSSLEVLRNITLNASIVLIPGGRIIIPLINLSYNSDENSNVAPVESDDFSNYAKTALQSVSCMSFITDVYSVSIIKKHDLDIFYDTEETEIEKEYLILTKKAPLLSKDTTYYDGVPIHYEGGRRSRRNRRNRRSSRR